MLSKSILVGYFHLYIDFSVSKKNVYGAQSLVRTSVLVRTSGEYKKIAGVCFWKIDNDNQSFMRNKLKSGR